MLNLLALYQLIELERQKDALNALIEGKIKEVQAVIQRAEAEAEAKGTVSPEKMYVIQNPEMWNKAETQSFSTVLTAKLHKEMKTLMPKWETDKKIAREARLSFIRSIVGREIESTTHLTVVELETLIFLLKVKHGN